MPRALSQTRALLKTRAHTLFRSSWVSQTLYSKLVTLTRGLSKIHAEDHREPKAFRRHRLDGPMTCHLMPFAPAAELRASCAEKPSPCKELRRLGTFLFHEHHRDISMLSLAHLCKELRRLGTSSFHEHDRGISMIPLAHADREAHHRHR